MTANWTNQEIQNLQQVWADVAAGNITLHATPSDLPKDTPTVPRQGDGAMAASGSGGMKGGIRRPKARTVSVNVTLNMHGIGRRGLV